MHWFCNCVSTLHALLKTITTHNSVIAMVMSAFGQPIVDYVVNLWQGHIDYLQRLPKSVIRRILCYVELEDIAKVSVLN